MSDLTGIAAAGTPCLLHGQPVYHTVPGDCSPGIMGGLPPLCGEEGCGICPTQADIDAYHQRQWHDAGRAVAEMTGLHYDEQRGFRAV